MQPVWYHVQHFFLNNLGFLCTMSLLNILFLFSKRLCSKASSLAFANAKTRAKISCRLSTSRQEHNFIIKIWHRCLEIFLEIMLVQSCPPPPPLNVKKRILLHVCLPKLHPVSPSFSAACKHCPLIIPPCWETRLPRKLTFI